jgi:hypothetical protein
MAHFNPPPNEIDDVLRNYKSPPDILGWDTMQEAKRTAPQFSRPEQVAPETDVIFVPIAKVLPLL